jgi:hypothetical protein
MSSSGYGRSMLDDRTDEVAQHIQRLTVTNSKLKRMLAKIGSAGDSAQFREKLEDERTGGQRVCKTIIVALKDSASTAEKKVISKLTAQFKTALSTYQSLSREIEQRNKDVVLKMSHSAGKSGGGGGGGGGGGASALLTEEESDQLYQSEQDQQIANQFLAYDVEEIEKRQVG